MKNKIFINAITSLVQVVIVTIVYFVLYKYLINTIGIDQLGIWSLILASTSILNISNLGLSSSVIKYVAKYKALNNPKKITKIIQTSLISVTMISGLVLLILIPFANLILKFIVPINYLNLSKAILPYSLLSLWINIQSGIFAATLDGFQRIEIKNIILIVGVLLYLIFSFFLVPVYGLFGVVYAQLLQATIILIANLVLVKVIFPEFPIKKFHWDVITFKEIYSYSIKFQGITITQLLYDPITKSLLTKFGGLSATGYYEMASRLIQRIRIIIISVNQVLVPTYATIYENSIENIKNLYIKNMNYVHYMTAPLFLFVLGITPVISLLWIGHYEKYFVIFLVVLTISWGFNIYAAPAYFAYLGIGELNWNLKSHFVIGALNLILGSILGDLYGAICVVYAWGISLIIGSILLLISFNHKLDLKFNEINNKENIKLFMWNLLAGIFSWLLFFYLEFRIDIFPLTILTLLSYLVISGYFIWKHSIRINLKYQIKNL